jgi:5-methylcytosine-specific restriction enzyme subunit McrC
MRSDQSKNPSSIYVYEHDTLGLPEISEDVFNSLCYFHDFVNDKYFSIGYKKVKFNQYVGIFSVRGTTIEVLPKVNKNVSKESKDEVISKKVLIQMLEINGYITAQTRNQAFHSMEKNSLSYVLFYQFLSSLEDLITQGLCKKYRSVEANVDALKGRLLFAKNLQKNSLRPNHWWTNHTVYTIDHQLNGILKAALLVLHDVCPHELHQRLNNVEHYFYEISPYFPNENYLYRIEFNRQTSRYKIPIVLACSILQNTGPTMTYGKPFLFALMFDMNQLFEKVVFKLLKEIAYIKDPLIEVIRKEKRKFFGGTNLYPDIVVRNGNETFIMDTKWKIIDDIPTIQDARQMFTYNLYFDSRRAILLYPNSTDTNDNVIKWNEFFSPDALPTYKHQFGVMKIKLVDENGLLTGHYLRPILDEIFD